MAFHFSQSGHVGLSVFRIPKFEVVIESAGAKGRELLHVGGQISGMPPRPHRILAGILGHGTLGPGRRHLIIVYV